MSGYVGLSDFNTRRGIKNGDVDILFRAGMAGGTDPIAAYGAWVLWRMPQPEFSKSMVNVTSRSHAVGHPRRRFRPYQGTASHSPDTEFNPGSEPNAELRRT